MRPIPLFCRFLAVFLLLVVPTSVPARCCAQEDMGGQNSAAGVRISQVRAGFAGHYKVGCWTPVWMTLEAGGQDFFGLVELVVNDADGVPARYADQGKPIPVRSGESVTVIRYARFGRKRSGLTVELRNEGGLVTSQTFSGGDFPLAQSSGGELLITVGKSLGVEETLAQRRGKDSELASAAVVASATELPDRWWGYEGVDILCWAGSQSQIVAELGSEQLEALETWVRLGGRFLLSVGANGESLLARGKRFARFNPGRFVEVVQQRRTADLERYAGASQPISAPGVANVNPLRLSVLADLPVREEAAEGAGSSRHPTVIRFPMGLGQVILVTVDLDQPPLSDWPQRTKLVARLLESSPAAREENPNERQLGQLTHVGFEDLGGQLHGALDQFADVPPFRFSWVAALLVLYILLIGPADYFFLRRVARGMEWTWITLPVVVLIFCGGAALLANAWKGSARRLNQVDLVDIDAESGLVRGTCWANLYTPRTEEFNLTFEASPPFPVEPPAALFTWRGLSGKGLGGMDVDRGSPLSLFSRPYAIIGGSDGGGAPARLEHLPVQVSSTKSLAARWWTTTDLSAAAKLSADRDGRLQGELSNPLKVELLDGVLFFEASAYKLKSNLTPGERLVFTSQSPVVHIERRLTQRRVVESGETKAPWNPESFDIPRIMEMMMFHDAAGGRSYTGLTNRQDQLVDLSGLLKTGRAVLLARAEAPAARILQDGEAVASKDSTHYTFYRLVLPVAKRGPNP